MSAAADLPAVELQNVSKRFGDESAVVDLSLTIPRGSQFGLIGINGAGKSTTIRMIVGLLRPDAGHICVLGHDPREDAAWCRARIGYVPEVHLMHRWMTVDEVVRFCRGFYPTWNASRCADLLLRFRLDPRKRVAQLSRGMQAKLSLTLALAHEPPVLLLDEPTSGLDPIVREDFLEGILTSVGLHEQAVLFSSHILSDVERIADTIGILHAGRLLAVAPTGELLERTKRIRLVLPDGHEPVINPSGVVWQSRDRREWCITLRDFTPETEQSLRRANPDAQVDVFDLSIEDIFKDFVRGQGVPT